MFESEHKYRGVEQGNEYPSCMWYSCLISRVLVNDIDINTSYHDGTLDESLEEQSNTSDPLQI